MAVENWPVGWFFCKLLDRELLQSRYERMAHRRWAQQRSCGVSEPQL